MNIHERTPAELLGTLTAVEEKNAPELLYLAGNPEFLEDGPRVSVVGSRKASPDGLDRARYLAAALAEGGITVVSGLAAGIDTAAHESAISAGGHTVAVLGTPLDRPTPAKNRELFGRIVAEHLAVSQFPIGGTTHPGHFPIRNRTMALLTDATVIVEAGESSGTRHQGWEALRLGRVLFLLESVVKDERLSWPAEMIGYGAQVLTRDGLGPLLENLPALSRGGEVPLPA